MLPELALGSHGDRNWDISSAPGMLPRFLCLPSCVIHGRLNHYSWGAPPCTMARSYFFLEINVSWNTVEHCQLSSGGWKAKVRICHIDPSLSLFNMIFSDFPTRAIVKNGICLKIVLMCTCPSWVRTSQAHNKGNPMRIPRTSHVNPMKTLWTLFEMPMEISWKSMKILQQPTTLWQCYWEP